MKKNDKIMEQLAALPGLKPTTVGAAERRIKAEREWSKRRFRKGMWDTALVLAIIFSTCAVVKAVIVLQGWNPFYVG